LEAFESPEAIETIETSETPNAADVTKATESAGTTDTTPSPAGWRVARAHAARATEAVGAPPLPDADACWDAFARDASPALGPAVLIDYFRASAACLGEPVDDRVSPAGLMFP
ncbi:hypothetical protein AAHH79_32775, partial [Burkholderia pseudomallei]